MTRSPAFLDSVGLLAVWNHSDQWHRPATEAYRKLQAEKAVLFSSSFVLLECANAAVRRSYRESVVDLRRTLLAKGLLLSPTEAEVEAAWYAYERGHVGSPGVVDLVSFQLMRRAGISRVLTNDRHFRDEGFETLFEG